MHTQAWSLTYSVGLEQSTSLEAWSASASTFLTEVDFKTYSLSTVDYQSANACTFSDSFWVFMLWILLPEARRLLALSRDWALPVQVHYCSRCVASSSDQGWTLGTFLVIFLFCLIIFHHRSLPMVNRNMFDNLAWQSPTMRPWAF